MNIMQPPPRSNKANEMHRVQRERISETAAPSQMTLFCTGKHANLFALGTADKISLRGLLSIRLLTHCTQVYEVAHTHMRFVSLTCIICVFPRFDMCGRNKWFALEHGF